MFVSVAGMRLVSITSMESLSEDVQENERWIFVNSQTFFIDRIVCFRVKPHFL